MSIVPRNYSCLSRKHWPGYYYTALTITVGFSILAFSSFIPTIYFGILTGFAMMVALMSNLTLLAALIMFFKPLGSEQAWIQTSS